MKMEANVHPIARWSLVGALALAVLMVIYYLTDPQHNGQVAFGIAVIGLTVAAFIYTIYARINTVQRTGSMALLMVIVIAILLPFFFLGQTKASNDAVKMTYENQLSYAAGKYATYCSQCHGLLGQGLAGPKLNGNTDLEKVNVQAIISAGIPDNANPATYLMPAWSDQNGGPFNVDDINALTAFVQSWDPVLRTKNGVPSNLNGFDLVFAQLDAAGKLEYNKQKLAAQNTDQPVDLTAMKSVIVPIMNDPSNTGGIGWNFLYPVPNATPSRKIKVKSGATVAWDNMSSIVHSVFSYQSTQSNHTGLIAFDIVQPGTTTKTVTMPTVTQETVITYYCSFHPAMLAQIIVEP